jgi:hypothetical protein
MMKNVWKRFWLGIVISGIFISIIGMLGYRLDNMELLPDQGASWYYWKLPNKEFWPRVTAWSFYFIHQILIWLLIYVAQFGDVKKRKIRRNQMAFVNIIFIALHIVQTHIWYDGLAQDVPVMSSQGSVIVMLVLIIIMDSERRGIFFGRKITKFPLLGNSKGIVTFVKRYHGYFVAWAVIYTFWYHPTVATPGHLVGFFYLFLLFIQLSMVYTPVHMNKYWMFTLEVLVLFHGTLVAIGQQNNMWPMFLFGFATMTMVTQIYGLGIPKWLLKSIQILYLIGVIFVFGGFTGHRTIGEVHQILWIPIIEYLLVFVFVYVIGGILKIKNRKTNI